MPGGSIGATTAGSTAQCTEARSRHDCRMITGSGSSGASTLTLSATSPVWATAVPGASRKPAPVPYVDPRVVQVRSGSGPAVHAVGRGADSTSPGGRNGCGGGKSAQQGACRVQQHVVDVGPAVTQHELCGFDE